MDDRRGNRGVGSIGTIISCAKSRRTMLVTVEAELELEVGTKFRKGQHHEPDKTLIVDTSRREPHMTVQIIA